MVDEDQVGIQCLLLRLEFLGLAAADEILRVRTLDARGERANYRGAGRTRQLAEFDERIRIVLTNPMRLQQQRAFAFAGAFEQDDQPSAGSACAGASP